MATIAYAHGLDVQVRLSPDGDADVERQVEKV